MKNNKKPLTEAEIISRLKQGEVSFSPLSIRFETPSRTESNSRYNGFIKAAWGKQQAKFGVEIKSLSTPKAFAEGLSYLERNKLPPDVLPMLIVPFLNEERLKELETEGISGIDLCGNGIVTAKEKFAIYRSGQPNQFSSS